MTQPILLNRTDTDDTNPPLLQFGELAVATGPTYTKMWLGDGTENRLLVSDDPADGPIFGGGAGGGSYLPLTGGTLSGPLGVNPALGIAQPGQLTVGGRGIIYSALNPTDSFALTFSAGSIYTFYNGTAYGPMLTLNVGNTTYLQLTGGNVAGPLRLNLAAPAGALPGTLFTGQEISFPGVSNNFDIVWNAYQNSVGNWVATAAGGPAVRLSGDVNGTLRISNALGPAGSAGEAVNWQDTAWFSRTTNSRINSILNLQAANNSNTALTITTAGSGNFPYLSLQNNGANITAGIWSDMTAGGNFNIGSISPGGAINGTPWVTIVPAGANTGRVTFAQQITVGGTGITYASLFPTHTIAFGWDDYDLQVTVDGVNVGQMAFQSNLVGYLPLAGGTLTGPLTLEADPTNPLEAATKQYVDAATGGTARYVPMLDPSNDVAVTAAGAAPILSGYETPVSAGDDWFMIRTMRDVDGTAIIMRGPTFPDPNAADGTEFWVGAGGNFLFWMQPTGQFILPADPTDPMAAVTKQYADALGGGGASVEVGDTAPATPAAGDLWWDTVSVKLYMWDGGQWVVVSNVPAGGGGGGGSAGLPPGVTDGSNAAPGEIGEFILANASQVISAGASWNVTTLNLTPGDWDVSLMGALDIVFNTPIPPVLARCGIFFSSGAPPQLQYMTTVATTPVGTPGTDSTTWTSMMCQFSAARGRLNTTTPVALVATVTCSFTNGYPGGFASGSSATAYAWARRVR